MEVLRQALVIIRRVTVKILVMEIFMILLYGISVFALYQSIQSDDSDFSDSEDSGEFNLIDSL